MFADASMLNRTTGRYPSDDASRRVADALAQFEERAPGLAESEAGADLSLAQAVEVLLPDSDPLVQSTLSRFLSVFDGATANDVGFRSLASFYFGLALEEQDRFPEGGYRTLVDALADGLDIRTSTPVTAVRGTERGVEVATPSGTLEASHAIVTVPLGVLKAGGIDFDPPLPPVKREAISTIGFGVFEKVALAYDERFWEPSPTGTIVVADERPLQWLSFLDLGHWYEYPVLLAVTTGQHARQMLALPEAERVAQVAALAKELGGPNAPDPVASAASSWLTDPFSRGCYSRIERDGDEESTGAAAMALSEPHGRVLFAGEATSVEALALVDGAWLSGIREAKRLLQSKRVALLR